jgi:uncharacterized membrane protein
MPSIKDYALLVVIGGTIGFVIMTVGAWAGVSSIMLIVISAVVGFVIGLMWARHIDESLSHERAARLRPDGRRSTR